MIRSLACHHLFHHVVICSIMWISVPSHSEWSHKLPTSIAHTCDMYTILFLFLESMLLFLDATVDAMFSLQHCDQGISNSSALHECVSEKICAHPRTHVIHPFTFKLWYHHVSTGSREVVASGCWWSWWIRKWLSQVDQRILWFLRWVPCQL